MDVKTVKVADLVKMMVGRNIEDMFERTYQACGEEALRVEDIKSGKRLRGVSMSLHTGEIVGLAGLVGAGRTELARAIFGVDPIDSGKIFVFGKEVHPSSPAQMVKAGVSLLPEDRKNQGLCLILPASDNVVMASLNKLFPKFFVNSRKEKSTVLEYIKDLRIATPSPKRITQFLSGGTQQKVVLAKWLCTEAKIFIFDEPTRGIDVGAKAEIHAFMNELVKNGGAVLMISSELLEVLGMSDRIFVMREGRAIKEFSCKEATQEKIIAYAMGGEGAKQKPSQAVKKGVLMPEKKKTNNSSGTINWLKSTLKSLPPVTWVVLAIFIIFSATSSGFFTINNMISIVRQGSFLWMLATAATIVLLSEALDLSLGSIMTFSGVWQP